MNGIPKEEGYYWVKMYKWDFESNSNVESDKWEIVKIEDTKDWGSGLDLYEFGNDFDTEVDKIYEYEKIEDKNA